MNRRRFLQTSGLGCAALALTQLPAFAAELADQTKRVGLIGTGWYGKVDLLRLIQVAPVEVVSLCDVDKNMVAEAAEIVAGRQLSKKKPRTYSDYREMLKEKDLDVVLIATPDHWHALPMIAAAQAGADIYVQKPIGVDVARMPGHACCRAQVRPGGPGRHATPQHAALVRGARAGPGRPPRAALASSRPIATAGAASATRRTNRRRKISITKCGPVRRRCARSIQAIHPRGWRDYMEYGNGTIGDMGIHMVDMVRWMMDLGWPKRISSTGGNYFHKGGKPNIPDMQTATFDYGDLQITWEHRHFGAQPDPKYWWGANFYGEKATLKASVFCFDYIPLDGGAPLHREWNDPKAKYPVDSDKYPEDKTEKGIEYHVAPAIREHMKDLLQCIATRGRPRADIAQGSTSTSMCVLANLSLELKRSLAWDEAKSQVVGDEQANQLLARSYRAPWQHPTPDTV